MSYGLPSHGGTQVGGAPIRPSRCADAASLTKEPLCSLLAPLFLPLVFWYPLPLWKPQIAKRQIASEVTTLPFTIESLFDEGMPASLGKPGKPAYS